MDSNITLKFIKTGLIFLYLAGYIIGLLSVLSLKAVYNSFRNNTVVFRYVFSR